MERLRLLEKSSLLTSSFFGKDHEKNTISFSDGGTDVPALSPVTASSHREAPLISSDPLADNTDVYAFKSPTDAEKIVLIANYIPFEDASGGPNWYNFGENIRYEIHVKNNADYARRRYSVSVYVQAYQSRTRLRFSISG